MARAPEHGVPLRRPHEKVLLFHGAGFGFGWFPGSLSPSLCRRPQDTCKYKSNNQLTGGSVWHTVDKRGSGAKLGFLGKPGIFGCHKILRILCSTPRGIRVKRGRIQIVVATFCWGLCN